MDALMEAEFVVACAAFDICLENLHGLLNDGETRRHQ